MTWHEELPPTDPARASRYTVAQLIGGDWQVAWKDRRGNRCRRTFGSEAAAREWVARQQNPPGPEAKS